MSRPRKRYGGLLLEQRAQFALLPTTPPAQVAYLSLVLPAAGHGPSAVAAASWGPAAVSLALFLGLAGAYRAGWLPRACWRVWDVPAWTATLLFMMEPLAALVGLLGMFNR